MRERVKRRRTELLVVTDLQRLSALRGVRLHTADEYLAGEAGTEDEQLTVVNLCRSYRYLSKGYYVSLLADARGQRVLPTLETIEAVGDPFVYFRALEEAGLDTIEYRLARSGHRLLPKVILPEPEPDAAPSEERRPLVTRGAAGEEVRYERASLQYRETTCVLGKTVDQEFRRPCSTIFRVFPVPLLRVRMYQDPDDASWRVGQIFPVPATQLDAAELDLLTTELTTDRVRRHRTEPQATRPYRIACLWDEHDPYAPSDEETLDKFERAAAKRNALFEIVEREDIATLAEYDALFIRTVTAIDHYSFTFAQTAESLEIPVIDDSRSIMRCGNKVFLHEIFSKNGIPTPPTAIISRRTPAAELAALRFPLIVKLPDGTFSHAVKKADDPAQLEALCQDMFRRSPLLLAQAFTPTPFDWRIGVLEGRLLFAAKYHMVKDHWQIVSHWKTGRTRYGKVEAVAIDSAPEAVRRLALDAAGLIGDGLYGVDLKETPGGPLVIEVNDNPNIIATDEDAVEKDRIYDAVIDALLSRVQRPVEPTSS